MSVGTIDWAYKVQLPPTPPDLTKSTAKLVLLCLANHCDMEHACRPKQKTIAEHAGLSVRSVGKAIAWLEEVGAIVRQKWYDHQTGRRVSTFYRLAVPEDAPQLPEAPAGSPPEAPAGKNLPLGDRSGSKDPSQAARPFAAQREEPKERPRNPVWDELVRHFGEPTTATEQRLRGKVVTELRDAGASPQGIAQRVAEWDRVFPRATLTTTALVKHWTTLGDAAGYAPEPEKPDEETKRARAAAQAELEAELTRLRKKELTDAEEADR